MRVVLVSVQEIRLAHIVCFVCVCVHACACVHMCVCVRACGCGCVCDPCLLPDHVGGILVDILYVGIAEAVVDWVKHAFITKFNEISSEVSASACMQQIFMRKLYFLFF